MCEAFAQLLSSGEDKCSIFYSHIGYAAHKFSLVLSWPFHNLLDIALRKAVAISNPLPLNFFPRYPRLVLNSIKSLSTFIFSTFSPRPFLYVP